MITTGGGAGYGRYSSNFIPKQSGATGTKKPNYSQQLLNNRMTNLKTAQTRKSSNYGLDLLNNRQADLKQAQTPTYGSGVGASTGKSYSPPSTGVGSGQGVNDWVNSMRASTSTTKAFDNSSTDSAVEKLRKQLYSGESSPDMPAQVNLDNYNTELASIQDLSDKYGFDYSREYAERQASILAQAQRDEIDAARARQEYETESAQVDLEHDFFEQYLATQQDLSNSGLNAGIASDRNTRLDMSRQYALSDILANQQLSGQEMDAALRTITAEELTYAEKLYQERMQQGFGNAMDVSKFTQSENQFQANAAMEQRAQLANEKWREFEFNNLSESDKQKMLQDERQFGTEMAWRQYEFENMSASEQAKLAADAEQFGMDMAWQRHKFEAGMAFDASFSGGSSGGGGGYKSTGAVAKGTWGTSKGNPPKSFQQDLTAALKNTGYSSSWIKPMSELIARESSWNPNAKNPSSTAHGYGQFLNSTRKNYEKKYGIGYTSPVNQLVLTMHYVKDRYGTPQKAINFHNKNNWY